MVPSPALNVLCAELTKEELAPMIYSEWPAYKEENNRNFSNFPLHVPMPRKPDWLNKTVVDELFGFGEKYDRRPPVFPKYPLTYNTIVNATTVWADSLYILAASTNGNYSLCSLRASLTANCSTAYRVNIQGGGLTSRCINPDRPHNPLAYSHRDGNATNGFLIKDWATGIAPSWAYALALNNGITDGDSSNARLLTQLIPKEPALDRSNPTIAEALSVLAGCSLMLSAVDSPFIQGWNYSTTVPVLEEPQYQTFPGTLRSQEYASGGVQQWQGVFYIVLVSVFLINIFCLVYFIIRGDLMTDFIEPQNLFALAINSPPSRKLEGACGGGPNQEQIQRNWFIKLDSEKEHFYISNGDKTPRMRKSRMRRGSTFEIGSPLAQTYTKLSNTRSSLL